MLKVRTSATEPLQNQTKPTYRGFCEVRTETQNTGKIFEEVFIYLLAASSVFSVSLKTQGWKLGLKKNDT